MSKADLKIEDCGDVIKIRLVQEAMGVDFILIEVDQKLARSGGLSVLKLRDCSLDDDGATPS